MSAETPNKETDSAVRPKLSVWMVNYLSASLIARALASLGDEDLDEILIWDNASGAAEVAALKELAQSDSRIKLFESSTNLGFGSAMNEISERSANRPNDIVWILNPDTELFAGSVESLRNQIENRTVDIVSPLIVCGNIDNPVVWFNGGGIDTRAGRCWHDHYGEEKWSTSNTIRPTTFMTGAAPMMTRAVWDKIGGFHDGLFLYWEDVEFSLRASDLTLTMGVHSGCTIWHLEGGSGSSHVGHSAVYYFNNSRNRIRVCGERSGRIYVALGPGLRETMVSILRPLLRERSGRIHKSFASLRGTASALVGPHRTLGSRRRGDKDTGARQDSSTKETRDSLWQKRVS